MCQQHNIVQYLQLSKLHHTFSRISFRLINQQNVHDTRETTSLCPQNYEPIILLKFVPIDRINYGIIANK